MIVDSLCNSAKIEQLHPKFKQAFDYLKNTDFSALEAGKVVLDGEALFISVADVNGKTKETSAMETHSQYIDIQIPLTGTETMGWVPTGDLKEVTKPYNAEKDIAFFADAPTTYVDVTPGQFAIFFPEDGHAPGIGNGAWRKIIVKVRV